MQFVLASASPYRRKILTDLGVEFDVMPSTVDEAACPVREPRERALTLARLKARDVAARNPEAYVCGCDTLVVSPGGDLLEKPQDEADARSMLKRMSGGATIIHSGICIVFPNGEELSDVSSSTVYFKTLSQADIDWWIETGLWEGRSGAFQLDGPGQLLIQRLDGDFSGVVGLPVSLLESLLLKLGVSLRLFRR